MFRTKLLIVTAFLLLAAASMIFNVGAGASDIRSRSEAVPAPTGVIASDNAYGLKVGIIWDAMFGASTYRIYRNTVNDTSTAAEIGTTAANYFYDTAATPTQTYFYWVRGERNSQLGPFSSPDQGTAANGAIVGVQFPALEPPPAPAANPVTASKAALGKALFWDEQLSSTNTVSCGTCHQPGFGGADPRTVVGDAASRNPGFDQIYGTPDDVFGSRGVPLNGADGNYYASQHFGLKDQVTGRKAPSYLNAGYARNGLFWDGRASEIFRDQLTNNILLDDLASLESQSAGPPVSDVEMAHFGRNWTHIATKIQNVRPLAVAWNIPAGLKNWIGTRTYPELFEEAFGTPEVTPARIAMAIATHERTLISDQTPLDRWATQTESLTEQEERGKNLFIELSCSVCHDGALLSDHAFHNIGVRPQFEDRGRGGVTNVPFNDAQFKTPVLRNIDLQNVYMHNGRFSTLEQVVDFYNRGGDFSAENINPDLIRPLNMTPDEKADLVAFMRRPLIDPRVANETAPFDRPRLFTESNRVPEITGFGRPGVASTVPEAVAVEPPLLGNPSFTIAVKTSVRSGRAILVISENDPGILTSVPVGTLGNYAAQIIDSGFGYGFASVSLNLPYDPALVGRTFRGRWYIQDPRTRQRYAVSKLITFTIFKGETDPPFFSAYDPKMSR
jgi:cytochrome c peroxidase